MKDAEPYEVVAERARTTGEKQLYRSWMTGGCRNGNSDQCSFDSASEYVLPDGSTMTTYQCCY